MQASSLLFNNLNKTAVIFPATFLAATAIQQVSLGLVFFARDLHHASAVRIGWISGTWTLCYVAGCLAIQPRFTAIPPRYLTIFAMSMAAVFSLGMQVAPNITVLFILSGLFGSCFSLFWPPLVGWLSSGIEGAVLNKRMSRFNLSWCTGAVLGPFICGWLSRIDVRLPLYTGTVLFIVTVLCLASGQRIPSVRNEQSVPGTTGTAPAADRSTKLRFPAWISHFSYFLAVGIVMVVFPVQARTDLLMTTSTIGTILFLRSLFNAVVFDYLGRHKFWHFKVWPMIVTQITGVPCLTWLAFEQSTAGIALLMCLFGISSGLSYAIALFHGLSGSVNRARRMALHESILALGSTAGAVIGGLIYEKSGMNTAYLTCAAVLLVTLFPIAMFAQRTPALKDLVPGRLFAKASIRK